MMIITDRIFNYIIAMDVDQFLQQGEGEYYEDNYDIYLNMCSLEDYGEPFYDLAEEQRETVDLDQFIKVYKISLDSMLYEALRYWYKAWDGVKVEQYVRGGYEDTDYLYVGTGVGYDTLSSDLLGCDCDGVARRIFVDFCNEPEEVMRKGGKAYMESKGKARHMNTLSDLS